MRFDGKWVAVTGASGFVGSNFVHALQKADANVRAVVHRAPMRHGVASVETVSADLRVYDQAVAALRGADYVVHAAGSVGAAGVGASQIMEGMVDSLSMTAQVLRACWEVGVRRVLIFSSSAGYPVTDHPVTENEFWSGPVHDAYFGYGWMRRYFELLGEFVQRNSKLDVVIVRPTAVYGPHDNFNPASSHVIPALIRNAVARINPFEVWGSGQEIRDFLYIEDMVEGALMALQSAPAIDPINIGYGTPTSIEELVSAILIATGYEDAKVNFNAAKPITIPKRMVDISKAKQLLAFQPRHSLQMGLMKTVEWYKSNIFTLGPGE